VRWWAVLAALALAGCAGEPDPEEEPGEVTSSLPPRDGPRGDFHCAEACVAWYEGCYRSCGEDECRAACRDGLDACLRECGYGPGRGRLDVGPPWWSWL
jgi:hypothetical protein